MAKTRVVNIRTYRGPTEDLVYIGRAGHGESGYFGNPFKLTQEAARGSTLEAYRRYFYDRLVSDDEFRARVLALKGKVLGCFCAPRPCHGSIVAEYLDSLDDQDDDDNWLDSIHFPEEA